MNHQRHGIVLGANTLAFALLLAGCGDFSAPDDSGAPAAAGTGGTATAGAGTGGAATNGGATNGGATSGGATSGGATSGGATTTGGATNGGTSMGGSGTSGTSTGGGGTGGSGGTGMGGASSGGDGGGGAVVEEIPCPDEVPSDTACGGDVLGTWAVTSCPLTLTGELEASGFGLGCSTAQVTSGSLQVMGTWTANADGTFTDNTITSGDQEVELPADCLEVSGTVTTCDRVSGPIKSSLGYESFDCVDNEESGGCTCSATIDQEGGLALVSIDASDSGSYTTMDTTLSFEEETEYSYCVMENTMALTLETVGKTGVVEGTIVLQKQ